MNYREVIYMQCQICRASGSNMKKCRACGHIWCATCAKKGVPQYIKPRSDNQCPYCGKYDTVFGA